MVSESEPQYQAYEWLGQKEETRLVLVKLKSKCQFSVLSAKGTLLRTVNLDPLDVVNIWISSNKGQKTLVVKMPKEYDCVRLYVIYSRYRVGHGP